MREFRHSLAEVASSVRKDTQPWYVRPPLRLRKFILGELTSRHAARRASLGELTSRHAARRAGG
jgi:hypothetical protein